MSDEDESGKNTEVLSKVDVSGLAHPRARATRELGERFAELLAEKHSHQLGVCAQLGISYRTHMHWMSRDAEPGSDLAEYQSAVMAALDRQRKADLEEIDVAIETSAGSHVSTVWAVRKHRHESRFKRFYEDAATKLELTGKDGGAIQVQARPPTRAEALAELAELAKSDPQLAQVVLRQLGSGEGGGDE